ncbi:Tubulin-specific chaperone A [Schizosaccharomyces pombe]|uniref:Tubulin-specific chaperone A n=1 Tax=Schizosaccharomyces pombe (strain 972 / ATCC 24843) TaxID=284812 RepID=TBCA_SCHPO|nr:tubulin-specific chaperone cofactor A Alp31 [Schizosaccharomyces pombe]Q9Y703.1 RecName: Full=Tubulin-specific chaperone A; AltName: Full=Altered polarity protein 31; AltName: Full=Tubulin-folding cofactor A; Short=CFA [Schizosaccharomyces pombe 972h-]BAA82293.1 Alp31 [Schizosaccharomyces pombe]CAB40194.1 tubulin specific chaperone cofactor A, Alp31 [Schizosaccharomyces pombe]|eukprot:NP_594162.1 tubulin-specific chaperone cofactor A Alp31 [Schizosaccharomyces pombe]
MSNTVRSLVIKTNVVKRIIKDVELAHIDINEAEKRVQSKIDNGEDSAEIEHQKFVLKKHLEALPDALVRLRNATNDLESISSDSAYEGTPELEQANEYLEKAKEVIEKEQTNFPTNGYH